MEMMTTLKLMMNASDINAAGANGDNDDDEVSCNFTCDDDDDNMDDNAVYNFVVIMITWLPMLFTTLVVMMMTRMTIFLTILLVMMNIT